MQIKLLLRDYLFHDKYVWPMTKVSYPIVFEKPVREGQWDLVNEQGVSVPAQITDVKKENELVKSGTLHFMTSLSKGETKEYTFIYGNDVTDNQQKSDFSSEFDIQFDKENSSFAVCFHNMKMVCRLPFRIAELNQVHQGSVYKEFEVVCKGTNGEIYSLLVRRTSQMPFWELQEQMSGFKQKQDGKPFEMQLTFENFDFTHRYSAYRTVEKIDAYLEKNKQIPVVVMPYEPYISWYQSKHIAFLGNEYSAGLFIRDNMEWDDYQYPIWSSNREFGITFTYDQHIVTAHFPLKDGKRFTGITAYEGNQNLYVYELWRYYTLLNLDKVKNWILDWEEDQKQYPRFFNKEQGKPIKAENWHYKTGEILNGRKMTEVIDHLSYSVNGELDKPGRGMYPVENREFACWTVIIDLTSDEMTVQEFNRAKAFFALMAYICMDENYMPTTNMLAGHPNFLADTAAVVGFFSALFPNHPNVEVFKQYFNKTVALNMKYHIRPDVAAYESLGGRETENLAGYSFAMLRPYIHVCKLYQLSNYSIPLICKNGAKWLNWITNCMSAPVNGERLIPEQGAHARISSIPYSLYEFAQLLENEYPEIARNTYAVCQGSLLHSFEFRNLQDGDIFRTLFHRNEDKGLLTLKSEKFTGYGCILREAVGTADEISVHIQQLDKGPHYRWGCFENTGNGGVHYYAGGKRFSFCTAEGTGDWNIGAEESNCGFVVLNGHTYHNIGFQDMTEPLRTFSLVKQIKLIADDKIKGLYKYKRVSLVGKDYLVLFDAVANMRTKGRFTWTVNQKDEFPQIYQLKPGTNGEIMADAQPVNLHRQVLLPPEENVKCIGYDGFGNFLSIVSHRKDLEVEVTEFGGIVILPERVDYVFEDEAEIHYSENGIVFDGYGGIISFNKSGYVQGVLTEGNQIGIKDILIIFKGKGAVSFEETNGIWSGEIFADVPCSICINAQEVYIDKGKYIWEFSDKLVLKKRQNHQYDGINGFVRDTRSHEFGFEGFNFNDRGEILTYPDSEE